MKRITYLFILLLPIFSFAQTEDCVDESLINPDIFCSFIYDPVCGCDGETYSNDCVALNAFGITEWTYGECSVNTGDCNDLSGIDFGLCATPLGIAYVDGSCQMISGCGYIVDEVNYVSSFFDDMDDCESSCGSSGDCLDLGDLDFGECEMALGIALIDGSCQFVSGCGYLVDEVDYSEYFYFSESACTESCGVSGGCLDLAGIDFGLCDFVLGIAVIDGTCQSVSGCDYVVDDVDYTENFFENIEDCQEICESSGCIDPDQIDFGQICPLIWDPVCGCDGVTYGNDCEAFYYGGVTSWTSGECGTVGACTDVSELDFGPCDLDLGFAILDGQCQSVSGCDYVVDETDYSNAFYTSLSSCMLSCEELDCYEPDIIDLEISCTEIYDPVCGCDGVTYSNSCEALNYFGITSWIPGACDENACEELGGLDFGPCEVILGVGLIEGQCTYISGCSYLVDEVDYSDSFYPDLESCETACEDCQYDYLIDPDHVCADSWEPICGCDSVTYMNICTAYYYYGVSDWTEGPCDTPADCINEEIPPEDYGCYEIYDPVCGCNGFTYSNDCFAFMAGVQSWTEGPCGTNVIELGYQDVKVYPNPVEDILTIEPENYIGLYSIVVFDATGRKILENPQLSGKSEVDLERLTSGVYSISLLFENGDWKNIRIIKD